MTLNNAFPILASTAATDTTNVATATVTITGNTVHGKTEVNVGQYQYTYDTYVLPAIQKTDLVTIFNNFVNFVCSS